MRPDAPAKAPTPEASEPSSPAQAAAPVGGRPKLNLQKRTVSEADPLASPVPVSDSKASPFGAARPVDTAAKEKEVEEKRQLAIRQKKEADDKAKVEKAEEKRLTKEKADLENAKETPNKEVNEAKETPASKEDGEEIAQPTTPKFDILRRSDAGPNDMIAQEDNDEENKERIPVDDKVVKPKEVVRPAPSTGANGSWRGRQPPQAAEGSTTAELEEDGWSTVSKPTKQRNNRRNVPSRAIAS